MALVDIFEEKKEVTPKWATATIGGNAMLNLTKPTSAKERPAERKASPIPISE